SGPYGAAVRTRTDFLAIRFRRGHVSRSKREKKGRVKRPGQDTTGRLHVWETLDPKTHDPRALHPQIPATRANHRRSNNDAATHHRCSICKVRRLRAPSGFPKRSHARTAWLAAFRNPGKALGNSD